MMSKKKKKKKSVYICRLRIIISRNQRLYLNLFEHFFLVIQFQTPKKNSVYDSFGMGRHNVGGGGDCLWCSALHAIFM